MTKRRVIRAADIEAFFGIGTRQARQYISDVRQEYHKQKHQPITLTEVCKYFNISKDEFLEIMD
jgi:DNA-directed RNA polymerase specialized sigma subunit